MPLQPQRINIPISGGIQGDETPEYLDPPALYSCVNFYHNTKSSLVKRKGYWTRIIRVLKSYDAGKDDDSTPDLPEVPLQITEPFMPGIGIDRFINAGNSVMFAGGGHLWTYSPDTLALSTQTPPPNTLRGPEIPDVEVTETQLMGITDPTVFISGNDFTDSLMCAAGAVNANGTLASTYVRSPGLPVGSTATTSWHLRISDPDNDALNIDVIDTLLDTSWWNPCVSWHTFGAVATILDFSHHTLYLQRFSLQTMRWDTLHTVLNGAGNVYYYDAAMYDDSLGYLATAQVDSSGHLFVRMYDVPNNTLLWGSVQIGDTQYTGSGALPGLSIACNLATQQVAVAWCKNTAGEIHAAILDGGSGAVQVADTTIAGQKSPFVSICHVKPYGISPVNWVITWQAPASDNTLSDDRSALYSKTYTSLLSVRGFVKSYPGVAPISQLFAIRGSAYMMGRVVLPNNADGTAKFSDEPLVLVRMHHELYQDDREGARMCLPMATWNYGAGVPFVQPPHVALVDTGSDTSRKAAGVILGAMLDKSYGDRMLLETFDQGSPNRYDSVPLGQSGSMFACGNPWTWDGVTAFETAFVHKPIIASITYDHGGDPLTPPADIRQYATGTYYIRAVYIHRDNAGRVTYSEPSLIQSFTIPADSSDYAYGTPSKYGARHVTISGLFVTARRPGTTVVAVYISDSNEGDAHFAQLLSVENPTFNLNATTPKKAADVDLILPVFSLPLNPFTSPTIYTEDGTLPAGYPQLTSHMVRWNNRFWIANGHKVTHSREFTEGDQPAFPDDFIEFLDRDITGLSPFDDRVVLFSTDSVMYRSGEGPSDSGQNSSYSSWNFITHEVGSNDGRCIVHTMAGMYFQSRRGIEVLKQDGTVNHVREVDQYFTAGSDTNTSDTVVGAISLPRDHQLRILFTNANYPFMRQLVFDYWTGTWTKFEGLQSFSPAVSRYAGDITVVGDVVYLASPVGFLSIEQPVQYDSYEAEALGVVSTTRNHIPWSVTTPWIKADGIMGFQRVWRSNIQFKCTTWTPVVTTALTLPFGSATAVSFVTDVPLFSTIRYKITSAGTISIGTTGITYQLSIDGGPYSHDTPLGTATSITTGFSGGLVETDFSSGTVTNGELITVTSIPPTFGISITGSTDYETDVAYVEDHGSLTILDLQAMRETSGTTRLGIGHVNQACSAYQLVLSSSGAQSIPITGDPTGVYEIMGIWSEFGIERGTGRFAEGAKR